MFSSYQNKKDDENFEEKKNKTALVVKIVLIFFGIIAVGLAAYYTYYTKILINKDVAPGVKKESKTKSDDFNSLFDKISDKNDSDSAGKTKYIENNCYIGDKVVESGKSIKLYSRKLVTPYENCENFAKERVCKDGYFLGNKEFKFTTCRPDVDCQLPDGSIIKNGEGIKLYSKNTVPFGQTCERYAMKRFCKDTVLSGDNNFIYKKCNISYDNSCEVSDGHILANNQGHVFYSKEQVKFGDSCSKYARRIMCSNASMQGGDLRVYKYWNCSETVPKDCAIDDIVIPHGKPQALYSKEYGDSEHDCGFYKEIRTCNNGVLDGQEEYHYSKCYDN